MQVVAFNGGRVGLVDDEVIWDITEWAQDQGQSATGTVLPVLLAWVDGNVPVRGHRWSWSEVVVDPPVERPTKIIAAAANYRDHADEMRQRRDAEQARTIREQGFFLKAPSALVGAGGVIRLPYPGRRTDYEGEIALVVGKTARHIRPAEAWDYVVGVTAACDVSLRGGEDRGFRKSFDTFLPLGPTVVTLDAIPDVEAILLTTRVNGEVRQTAHASDMVMPIAELLAWMSDVMTLNPGDVVLTGTPKGVGPLASGDRVAVEVSGAGVLTAVVEGPAT